MFWFQTTIAINIVWWYLVNAQNVKCTFLRRIIFYFILRTQLVRKFCSIIFHIAQSFFVLLNFLIFMYYYFYLTCIMFSSYFIILRVSIYFDILFNASLNFAFSLKIHYFLSWVKITIYPFISQNLYIFILFHIPI